MSKFSAVYRRTLTCIAASLMALPLVAQAADGKIPDPLTIVVGYAPGGAADLTARAYAEQLRKDGAGTVIVENRTGASGRIGLNYVKDSAPNGSRVYLMASPLMTIFPLTYKDPGYDTKKDFRAIATLVDIPTAISAGADQPFNDMKGFVEWVKTTQPKGSSMGVATLGSSGHLGILAVNTNHNLKIEPVAYRGASPMLIDVASGVVPIGWDAVASMMSLNQAGKIKFLGVSGTKRLDTLPDVKTLSEQGFPEFEAATSFYAIVAPSKIPDATAAALEAAFMKASANEELKKQLGEKGLLVAPANGADTAKRGAAELETWRPVVKRAGIQMD
ncbi:tripartite tricarboxylate transporter substrate binding protein [Pusillimonas sp. ANT_WB101]|uniref:Bug family tripartite tricarboxylate transporter substrate binding protein n=1 Tax=Pusillimonas sp. ANT_WB101 TaxID=2597356 RepID=UPI0021020F18|nr:tripartite tricarboxylate transporter substrate-binding protein [Pusillimonas sp. ANT_WB101]